MDIIEELYKWQKSHNSEEWELASKETEYLMDDLKETEDEVDYFIKKAECIYNRTIAIINRK